MAFGYGFDNVGQDTRTGGELRGEAHEAGPVDCSTGLFVHRRTDLYVADTLPLNVMRVYRTNDGISRDFGIGANHNYGMFLSNPTGAAYPPIVDLMLADGRRVRFQKISGNGLGNSVYQHMSSPSVWLGATLQSILWPISGRSRLPTRPTFLQRALAECAQRHSRSLR